MGSNRKGYEYEKGKFVILKEEDFARVDVEATQTVDIMNFVSLDDVDPLLFYKPYYLEAAKGGDKAYVLSATRWSRQARSPSRRSSSARGSISPR